MIPFIDFIVENYYYHGTSIDNAKSIEQHGLNPSKSLYDGKVYMTKNYGEASKYAKIASNGKFGVIYRVHKDHLDPKNIHNDHSGIIEYKGSIKKEHLIRS